MVPFLAFEPPVCALSYTGMESKHEGMGWCLKLLGGHELWRHQYQACNR